MNAAFIIDRKNLEVESLINEKELRGANVSI